MKKGFALLCMLLAFAGLVGSIIVHFQIVLWQQLPSFAISKALQVGSSLTLLLYFSLRLMKMPYLALLASEQKNIFRKYVPVWGKTGMVILTLYWFVMLFIDGMPGGKNDLVAMRINSRLWILMYAIMCFACAVVLRCWEAASALKKEG